MNLFNSENVVYLPLSKSIGARFLVASYFAGILPALPDYDDSDDMEVLQQALLTLFADEEPIDFGGTPLDIGASGTALRFVTAVCASSPQADFVITGTNRAMKRPMAPLIDVLNEAGAKISPQGQDGTGPYQVTGSNLTGGDFSIRGDISSQYISALMLVAPTWEKGLKLNFTTELVSRPYLLMTKAVMEVFGVKADLTDKFVKVAHENYKANDNFRPERDWSGAAFFYEAVLLGKNSISIADLFPPKKSLQGDSLVADFFLKLGVVSDFVDEGVIVRKTDKIPEYFETDLSDYPDMVPALTVGCALRGVKFKFTGVSNLRLKESDRLYALSVELKKLGIIVITDDDSISWEGEKVTSETDVVIQTYEDHRIAMAFAMVAFSRGTIRIANPSTVRKSFRNFWLEISKIGLNCHAKGDIMEIKMADA